MAATTIVSGRSLSVTDYRCTADPHEAPFVELHDTFSVSYVRTGSFGCQSRGRSFELVPGSVLIGFPGDEFMCTHDHGSGDECLSVRLAPALAETIGDRAVVWRTGCVPPLAELMVLGELAQAAADGTSDVGPDEAGLLLAARFVAVVAGRDHGVAESRARDRRRAVEAALWIDEHSHESIDLECTAR